MKQNENDISLNDALDLQYGLLRFLCAKCIFGIQNLFSELMWTLTLRLSCSQFPNMRHPTSCVAKHAFLPQSCPIESCLSFCAHVIIRLCFYIQLGLLLATSTHDHYFFVTKHPFLQLYWVTETRRVRVVRLVLGRIFCCRLGCFCCESCHSFTV